MTSSSADGGYPPPTDQQWAAIRATDDHVLVSSSAGTGKTFTVVTRILYQLGVPIRGEVCASPIELRDVAAITFTNKAAAELKSKLREALRKVGRRPDAYRVDSARIGTIHGFCADILREFALRTGRNPSLHLVEEAESILSRSEAVRDALLDALEDNLIPGLEELVAAYSVEKLEANVVRLVDQGDQLSTLVARAGEHAPRERALLALAKLARDRMEARYDEAGQVDFDRMIAWTRDLIRDEASVRRALQRRVRVLFIDEFQDVDPAQREIAYLLGEPESGRTDTTRLMLVGDPKQSIYRFRNADVTVWREVEQDFAERGWKGTRVVPLLENRRSVAPILAFVDHTIGRLLDRPVTEGTPLQSFEIPYAPMTAVRLDSPETSAVEIVTVPPHPDGKMRSAEDVRLIEARALAERARLLHDEHGVLWREMAVLFTGWGAAEKYDQALRERGVPTYILRDEGFYSCLEVTDVLIALEAIRNPSDDRALFGFLRSPFVGLTDESLLHIARQRSTPYWSELAGVTLETRSEDELLARGIELLSRLGALRDRVSSAELIETLLAETGYLAHLELLGREGQQRIANLRKLVRMARALSDGSVGDFLDVVARQREVEAREGEAQLYGETEDVVTITSVHCAKGLEWKVVFWCDLIRTPPSAKAELLIGRRRILMPEVDGDQPPEFDAFKVALEAERKAESKRLWYVAATRAKDLLVLSGVALGTGRSTNGSVAGALRDAFSDLAGGVAEYESAHGVRYAAAVRGAATDPVEPSEGDEARTIGDPENLSRPYDSVLVPMGRGHHSATELMAVNRCERRHWLRYIVGLREPALRRRTSGEHTNAIRRGLIVHDVLENYQQDVELGVLLEAAIGRWDPDAPAPEAQPGVAYRRRLTSGIETILSKPEYRDVLDRDGARREVGFSYVRAAGESIEGKIDLIAPGGDGYAIVDVKTTECDADVAVLKAEQYAPQRAAYSQAVEAISGSPVVSFGFQFAGEGAHVGGARTQSDRAGDERVISGLIQLVRGGARELTRFPAECGFCGYKEAGWCPGATGAVASQIAQ